MRGGDYYWFKEIKLTAYDLAPTAWTSHQVSRELLNWIISWNGHSRATRHGGLLLSLIGRGELNITQCSGVPVPKTPTSANSFRVQYCRRTSSQMSSFHCVRTESDDRQLSVLSVAFGIEWSVVFITFCPILNVSRITWQNKSPAKFIPSKRVCITFTGTPCYVTMYFA
jgi:hypothetical protein